jgi:hypothetical protein
VPRNRGRSNSKTWRWYKTGKITERLEKEAKEKDEIDKMIEEIEREELRRAKLARIREYRLESEKRVKELEKSLESMYPSEGGTAVTPLEVEAAKAISSLPEDMQKKVLSVLAIIKSSGRTESSATLLPLVLSSVMSNPKASTEDTASIVLKTIETMTNLMKREEKSDVKSLAEAMKSIIETVMATKKEEKPESKIVDKILEKAVDAMLTPSKSWIEDVLENPEKYEKLQRIFGRTDPELLKIIRDMKNDERQWMMMLKKLDLDTKLKLLQLQQEEMKRKAIEKGLKRVISAAAQALEESSLESTPMPEGKKVITLICDECGSEIKVPPDAKSVICPKCGASYKK